MKMLSVVCTWVMLSCPCIARTITVDDDGPADFDNIFEAIYDANDCDTIIVADGTYTGPYNNDLDFRGKAITLRSESGPENCIIDCTGGGRGFYFQSGEDANSVLDGFTITNGIMLGGGGIHCKLSSPTISNCIITGNHAGAFAGTGGGIGCVMSSPIITNCTIVGNSANGGGGGISCYQSSPKISNCTISNNSAGGTGGISCYQSSPTITDCNIIGNEGGGIDLDGNATIANCRINGNTAPWGGGVLCWGGNSTITNCEISGNSAEGEYAYGGGILCFGPWSLEITNSTITGNQAEWGGGIYCGGFNLVMNNCTLTGNLSPNGDALACDSHQQLHPSSVQLSNCILWDNGAEIWNNDNSTITITYSDVRGSWPGEGNIDANPCFVGPGFWGDANGPNAIWVDGDYHLLATSPCIDTGDPNYITEPNETDLDGNPRVINGRIDMGAYEYSPPISAEVEIVPRTLNLKSEGKWIVCKIRLDEDYDVGEIKADSVLLEYEVEAASVRIDEGRGVVLARFGREEVQEILETGEEVEVVVSGELVDGTRFEGADVITVIDRGPGKSGR